MDKSVRIAYLKDMQPDLRKSRITLIVMLCVELTVAPWLMLRHFEYGIVDWPAAAGVLGAHLAVLYMVLLVAIQFAREIRRQIASDLFGARDLGRILDSSYPTALPASEEDGSSPGLFLFPVGVGPVLVAGIFHYLLTILIARLRVLGTESHRLVYTYMFDRQERGPGSCVPLSLDQIWILPVVLLVAGLIVKGLLLPGGIDLTDWRSSTAHWGLLVIAAVLAFAALLWNSFQSALVETVLDRVKQE